MKTKCLIWICLVSVILAGVGCRKKSPPPQEVSKPKVELSEQPMAEQVASDKLATQEPKMVKPVQQAKEPVSIKAGSEQAPPEETEYFAVFMEGKKVGYAIQNRIVADGKVTSIQEVKITVNRIGIPVTAEIAETTIETTDGRPLGFESVQDMSIMAMKVTGTVDKQGNVNVIAADQKQTLEWPKGAVLAEGLRLLTLEKGLKEGTQYSVKIFNPGILMALDAQVVIGPKKNVDLLGRIVALTEVNTTYNVPGAGNIVSTSYIDDELHMQKTITPMAGMRIEMIGCTKEFALSRYDVLEMVDKMFLSSPVELDNLSSVKLITYFLRPVKETDRFIIPSNDNQSVQKLASGTTVLTVEPVSAPAGASFPYRGTASDIRKAMQPNRFLQSDNKQIIELARSAIGQTKDAAQAVKKIEAFVAQYVENRSLSVGYASALEVAGSRQGDCSEFAVLTAAMCRAVGIPAQVVVGVAYVKDFAGIDGFGGHAWVQAYVGGRWVGLDASFKGGGRGGYDAGHIALASGDGEPMDFFNLATALGKFKIDRVEVKK